jgi:hypothetical protein
MTPIKSLTRPHFLYSRSAVLSKPCPIPTEPGAYAWFFKEIPGVTPTDGCETKGNLTLLYVGISPDRIGRSISAYNLRKHIINHYLGDSADSTLRRSLGVLLTDQSDFPLRRVGSGRRMTFTHLGEQWLDQWMEDNAFVCWVKHETPWRLEQELLETLSLPLNIKGNRDHIFSDDLNRLRTDAIRSAREMAVAREDNQQRRV